MNPSADSSETKRERLEACGKLLQAVLGFLGTEIEQRRGSPAALSRPTSCDRCSPPA